MSFDSEDAVVRDDFAYSWRGFLALPEELERVEGSSLRRMFLPNLNPEGRKKIADHGEEFVISQLKHYGVAFDASELKGNGTLLLNKVLLAEKCDQVPKHITETRELMRTEWLQKLTPEEMSSHPDLVMERFFLSSGRPDHSKTSTVVGIPFKPKYSTLPSQMAEAAKQVKGLHHAISQGMKTKTVFMGWNKTAVNKAAKAHLDKEKKEVQAAEDQRTEWRTSMHTEYLAEIKRQRGSKNQKALCPIGNYIVDCNEIEKQWPDKAEDLELSICETDEPNIFEASFDFGILEGVMILCSESARLEKYCSQLDEEDEEEREEDEDEDEDEGENGDEDENEDEVPNIGRHTNKRKAGASRAQGRAPKKTKSGALKSRKYFLKLKCRETGEGQIYSRAEKGMIQFKDALFASFTGKISLPLVGRDISFTGRKISHTPPNFTDSWGDYSESSYEYERVARWR